MKKYQVIASYVASFILLSAAVVLSIRYLMSIVESSRVNYRSETVYLTQGDSLHNFYSAAIPEGPVRGMLVLNAVTLSPEGYKLAAEKGIIVVFAAAVTWDNDSGIDASAYAFRKIISAAAERYGIRDERVMIGDFSEGDTAYVTCRRARNRFMAEPFTPVGGNHQNETGRTLVDERELISWAASVLKKGK